MRPAGWVAVLILAVILVWVAAWLIVTLAGRDTPTVVTW